MKIKPLPSLRALRNLFSYDPTTGELTRLVTVGPNGKKGQIAGIPHIKTGYRQIKIDGECYRAHRIAWKLYYGKDPNGEIDHINHNGADNRIENLREANHLKNMRNKRNYKNNKLGVPGVNWYEDRNGYRSQIRIHKRTISLGSFKSFFDAVCARKSAENRHGFHPNHGALA